MRVLTAIDLSVSGHDWLMARAGGFAARLGAKVDALYIHPSTTPDRDVEGFRDALRALLLLVPDRHRGEARTAPGELVDTLLRLSEGYDALVVGPREPGALEAMLRGPIAARVLRRAPVPVLVPRRGSWPSEPLKMLAGLDVHGDIRQTVFDLAATWASRLDGVLDAAFAAGEGPPPIKDKAFRAQAERAWKAARAPDQAALDGLLSRAPERHRGRGIVRQGEPDEVLVELSSGYHLVVVGNRERQGLGRYLLGTVATTVVRECQCDVLTLPTARLAGD